MRIIKVRLKQAILSFSLLTCTAFAGQATDIQHYPPADINAPYSPAVKMGGLLFLAGQVGRDASGNLPEGIQAQTHVIMKKIKALVEQHGSSMDRIGKCTAFLVDMAEWGAFNEVYAPYFAPGKRPARSAVGTKLGPGFRIEVECIAALK